MNKLDLSGIDLKPVLRGTISGLAQGIGQNVGEKMMKAASVHADEGDLVASAVGVVAVVGGGVLSGVGRYILMQVIPNNAKAKGDDND